MLSNELQNTTHVTIADAEGNIVTSTQTLNSLFGSRIMIPGTGIIPNNYMLLFDPHPGNALSLMPGKRITSGITALIGKRDGKPIFALGLPGAHRIPAAAMQTVLNIVDHGMSLQEAVEAPRVFTQGQEAEIEKGFPEACDRPGRDGPSGGRRRPRRRRHVRHRFPCRRRHDRRRLLARRRHAARHRRRAGPQGHPLLHRPARHRSPRRCREGVMRTIEPDELELLAAGAWILGAGGSKAARSSGGRQRWLAMSPTTRTRTRRLLKGR